MSSYGIYARICGVPCGLILRDNTRNGRYYVLFEREYASLEQIEAIDWAHPTVETVQKQPGVLLPTGYGFDTVRIAYDSGLKTYIVELQTASQYLGDVTAYQTLLGSGPWAPASANGGAHNAVYRGRDLGGAVTEEQYAAIAAGTFDGLYIGDYWTIGNAAYRIAAFDYYLGTGDVRCTTHHVVIVPDAPLYSAKMNDTTTTEGGYVGSAMYTQNLEQAKAMVRAAFPGHILKKRLYLCNAISDGKPSSFLWRDSEVELMSGMMAAGIAYPEYRGAVITTDSARLPLFTHDPQRLGGAGFWLMDTPFFGAFCSVDATGLLAVIWAGLSNGVRPVFCIC